MSLPNTPKRWAIHLSSLLKYVESEQGTSHFPVDVKKLALDYSKQVFPNEPIDEIKAENIADDVDGMLVPNQNRDKWLILYNKQKENTGRTNFTIAHEFGHYLLHRSGILEPKSCTRSDMSNWQIKKHNIEVEANTFAANLLMPANDVCEQIHNQEISLELVQSLASRYQVSLHALSLRLISLIKQPAMIIAGRDGFMDSACSNKRLMKLGFFYSSKKQVIELPSSSLALSTTSVSEIIHEEGIWIGSGKVKEILIYKTEEFSLSLLLYDSTLCKADEAQDFTVEEEDLAELII